MKCIYSLSLLLCLMVVSCSGDDPVVLKKAKAAEQMQYTAPTQISDTTLSIVYQGFDYEVDIKTPEGLAKGTILVLPGWNFINSQWCDSTTLCAEALEQGYILVLPDMKKSIYAEHYFPETREDWLKYPTRKWLRDSVIGRLQTEFELFSSSRSNYVLGLSTGGRGALLIALDMPEVFSACASLSGDYDQYMFPNDNLYVGYYGRMRAFEDRWKQDDNPRQMMIEKGLNVPLYIGHGETDPIVPFRHFELLKEFLDVLQPTVEVECHSDSLANHNYTYWNSEVQNVLNFFEKNK